MRSIMQKSKIEGKTGGEKMKEINNIKEKKSE